MIRPIEIDLTVIERLALGELADKELRSMKAHARFILRRELIALGLLEDEDDNPFGPRLADQDHKHPVTAFIVSPLYNWMTDEARKNNRTLQQQVAYAIDQYCRTTLTLRGEEYPPAPEKSVQDV